MANCINNCGNPAIPELNDYFDTVACRIEFLGKRHPDSFSKDRE
jgi:hypothetical protein